jgi:DNA-binding XRE family transcriptional regulator
MDNKQNFIKYSKRGIKNEELSNSSEKSFSCKEGVKESKNRLLKERLQTLIRNKGWSNHEFYSRVGITRQHYYFLSWGLWNPPLDVKIKISRVLEVDSALIWREE